MFVMYIYFFIYRSIRESNQPVAHQPVSEYINFMTNYPIYINTCIDIFSQFVDIYIYQNIVQLYDHGYFITLRNAQRCDAIIHSKIPGIYNDIFLTHIHSKIHARMLCFGIMFTFMF